MARILVVDDEAMVRTLVREAGVPLHEAVGMATLNPALALHLSAKGRLEPGTDADLVLLDDDLGSAEGGGEVGDVDG